MCIVADSVTGDSWSFSFYGWTLLTQAIDGPHDVTWHFFFKEFFHFFFHRSSKNLPVHVHVLGVEEGFS